MWRTFGDKYVPKLEPRSLLKTSSKALLPAQPRRPPNRPVCSPQELSTYTGLRERVTLFAGELRPGTAGTHTHRSLGSWPRSRFAESLVPGSAGWAGVTPMQIPARAHPLHSPRYPPDPWWKQPGALPRLYKQENMTTIRPKGFLLPWQHTKHEMLPPFSGRICKAGDRSVGRRAPGCYRNNAGRCRSFHCRTPGNCQNCRS